MNDLSAMKREKNKTFRIKDIARLAGVSEGTVDRVLHDRGEVSEQTKEQVWDIIKKNGYQSNRLASRLASKKTFRIVAILPQITEDNSYWQQPLKGIDIAAKEFTGFGMNFETVNYDGACELDFEEKVSSVLNTLPDGIIFSPTFTESSRRMVALAQSQMVSYAFIDTNLPDCKSIGFFGQDAYMGGRTGARLVCNMIPDKSDVAIMLIGRQDNISHRLQDRAKGFISFVEEQAYKVFNLSTNKVDLNTDMDLNIHIDYGGDDE